MEGGLKHFLSISFMIYMWKIQEIFTIQTYINHFAILIIGT